MINIYTSKILLTHKKANYSFLYILLVCLNKSYEDTEKEKVIIEVKKLSKLMPKNVK